jgi:hypothetical protein
MTSVLLDLTKVTLRETEDFDGKSCDKIQITDRRQ